MVITNVNQVVYRGDGVTTAFPFTFRIIDATDIKLLLIDADGTETDIQSDYFVDTVNNTVHYPGYAPGAEPPEADQPAPVQTGQKLVIYRELPITQEKNLGDKWPFFVIELGLDKLTLILQQIYGWWGRTLKFGVGWQIDHPDFDTTIPVEAGKTWRVNDEGTGFVATGDPDEAVVVANNAKDVAAGAKATAEGIAATAKYAKDIAEDAMVLADDAKYVAARAKATAEGIAAAAQADWNVTDTTSKAFIKNKPDVLLKSGGTLTGAINTANKTWNKLGDDASFGDYNIGGKMCIKSQTARNTGIAFFNETDTNVGEVEVNNAFDFNKPVKENGGFLVPIGVVQAFAGTTIPTGWLLCDGSAVSRTTYANLYACIGTTYGAGNGSTTFNLPNLTDKFIQGSATAGTEHSAGLPNITGQLQLRNGNNVGFELNNINGAFSAADSTRITYNVLEYDYEKPLFAPRLKFSAHDSSSIYGKSTTVQPPALTMRYIIKY